MKAVDLTGQKYGRWTVIKRSYPNTKKGEANWLCRCDCGSENIVRGNHLRNGDSQSCGCLRRELKRFKKDLTGRRFGRLTVIKRAGYNKWKQIMWLCKCDCGKENKIQTHSLMSGNTKSCGCLKKETNSAFYKKIEYGLASMRQVMKDYKVNAKKRGRSFELTEEQFHKLTQQDCHYCGAKPNNIAKKPRGNGAYIYNGLDRVNNKKGYTIDNVVPCCKRCNTAKGTSTLQEFKDRIKKNL